MPGSSSVSDLPNLLKALPPLLLLWMVAASAGTKPQLLDFELRDLRSGERYALERYRGRPLLLFFFQPDCSWCLRQVRAIHQVLSDCEGAFEVAAVGVNGDRRDLQREVQRLRPRFDAFEASPALLENMGGVPATPFFLLADAQGRFSGWLRGYAEPSVLVRQIPDLQDGCSALYSAEG